MRYIQLKILIILILTGCNSGISTNTETTKLDIKEPKLSELKSSNTEFSKAIYVIQEHLAKLNVPIDSIYYVGVDSTSGEEWEFRFIHYNNYIIQAEADAEKKRIDSLEKAGVTEYYLNFIPPTGNWGGYDRTIVYSSLKHEIIADLVDQ